LHPFILRDNHKTSKRKTIESFYKKATDQGQNDSEEDKVASWLAAQREEDTKEKEALEQRTSQLQRVNCVDLDIE
jgi:hypothetical protein